MAYYGAVRNLIWRIHPPLEVVETRKAVHAFLAESGVFFPPEVERQVLALLNDVDRAVYTVRVDKKPPEHLALLLITNVIGKLLPSGMFHTHRGVLSGKGHSMLAMWDRCLNQLRDRGYYTEEEAETDRKWVREQIKDAG